MLKNPAPEPPRGWKLPPTDAPRQVLARSWARIIRILKMKLTWRLRANILMHRTRQLRKYGAVLIALSILALALGLINQYMFDFLHYMQDSAVATLVGALIGAMTGGLFSYLAAVDVHREELLASALLRKRDDLLIPLYGEIKKFRKEISSGNLYEMISKPLGMHFPDLAYWNALKEDMRALQVPNDLSKALDSLLSGVAVCKKEQGAVQALPRVIELTNKTSELFLAPAEDGETKEERYTRIWPKVIHIHVEIASIPATLVYYRLVYDLETNAEDIANCLELLIKFINDQYEKEANWL